MHKSRLLRDADVVVSVVNESLTRDATEALAVAFPPIGRNVAYRRVTQSLHTGGGMARQTGAMVCLDAAEREGWFSTYNWVIRLNPDVIIRDDGFLREAMAQKDVDAVFANCNKRRTGDVRVMTDFMAWRPKAVQIGAFRLPEGHALCTKKQQHDSPICNSERAATRAFRPVLESGRYVPDTSVEIKRPSGPQALIIYSTIYFCLPRVHAAYSSSDLIFTQVLLPNATLPGPHCRVAGAASSVLHRHNYLVTCRAELASDQHRYTRAEPRPCRPGRCFPPHTEGPYDYATPVLSPRPARCPVLLRPRGLLYNHVSKQGGSTFVALLQAVKRINPGLNVVLQRDVKMHVVTEAERNEFFVIAGVRPPCAFAQSLWSYRSDEIGRNIHSNHAQYWVREALPRGRDAYGLARPYNTTLERERFEYVARTDVRVNGLEGYFRGRMGLPEGSLLDAAHCWVRVDARFFAADFRKCIAKYAACGGQELKVPDFPHRNAGGHSSCGAYFAGMRDLETFLMDRSPEFKARGSMGGLFAGSCC